MSRMSLCDVSAVGSFCLFLRISETIHEIRCRQLHSHLKLDVHYSVKDVSYYLYQTNTPNNASSSLNYVLCYTLSQMLLQMLCYPKHSASVSTSTVCIYMIYWPMLLVTPQCHVRFIGYQFRSKYACPKPRRTFAHAQCDNTYR